MISKEKDYKAYLLKKALAFCCKNEMILAFAIFSIIFIIILIFFPNLTEFKNAYQKYLFIFLCFLISYAIIIIFKIFLKISLKKYIKKIDIKNYIYDREIYKIIGIIFAFLIIFIFGAFFNGLDFIINYILSSKFFKLWLYSINNHYIIKIIVLFFSFNFIIIRLSKALPKRNIFLKFLNYIIIKKFHISYIFHLLFFLLLPVWFKESELCPNIKQLNFLDWLIWINFLGGLFIIFIKYFIKKVKEYKRIKRLIKIAKSINI